MSVWLRERMLASEQYLVNIMAIMPKLAQMKGGNRMEKNGHFIIVQYKNDNGEKVRVPISNVEKIHFFKDGTYFIFKSNGDVYEFDNRMETIVYSKF